MKKNKILLISPKPNKNFGYKGIAYSLLAISSYLYKEKKYELKLFKSSSKKDIVQEVLAEIDDSVLCIGISMMTGYQIQEGLKILKEVKKISSIPTIVGGSHPSILPEQTLENQYIDFVIRAQGERTFYELVKALEKDKKFEKVLGLSYKKNGKIIHNKDRPFEDINNFPEFPLDLINLSENTLNTELGGETVNYTSSQGCPYCCGFCSEQTIYRRRWVGLKPERVIKDIEFFYKKGIKNFMFTDSNFFVDKNRVEKICKLLLDKNIKINWGLANGRTENLLSYSDEQWAIMKKSGLKSILIGAESGDNQILKLIEKGATVQDTMEFTKKCEKFKIRIYFSFILGFPFPKPPASKEDKEKFFQKELRSLYEIVDKVYLVSKNHSILIFIYTPYSGTPLYSLAEKNGFKGPSSLEEWANYELHMKNTPWIDKRKERLVEQLAISVFPFIGGAYKEKINKMKGIRKISFKLAHMVLEGLALFRWKMKFFAFPVEYNLIKILQSRGKSL